MRATGLEDGSVSYSVPHGSQSTQCSKISFKNYTAFCDWTKDGERRLKGTLVPHVGCVTLWSSYRFARACNCIVYECGFHGIDRPRSVLESLPGYPLS